MKSQKNNTDNKNCVPLRTTQQLEKREHGIHPDMIAGAFKVKNIQKGMTISGVYISDIVENPCSEFIVIKKDTFYKNIPSKDTFLSMGQKIRVNNRDKRVETLIDNNNICKITMPKTNSVYFLSNKKDYLYINNIQIVCGNNKKEDEDSKINEDLFL